MVPARSIAPNMPQKKLLYNLKVSSSLLLIIDGNLIKINREKLRTLAICNARIAHQIAKSSPSSFQQTF